MKKIIETNKAPAPVGPYSQAVEVDGTLFCSGQIPIIPETGAILTENIEDQTKQVMKNIESVLTAADYKWGDVVKTMILLTDLGDFEKVNNIYAKYFTDQPPARSCFQVSALPKGVNVEIEVVARRG